MKKFHVRFGFTWLLAITIMLGLSVPGQAQPKTAIAVLPLEMMGEFTLAPMAIRSSMVRLLEKTDNYRVIRDSKMLKAAEELNLTAGMPNEQQCMALGKALEADLVVFGGISYAAPMFVTLLSLMDVTTGSVVNMVTQPYEGIEADWLRINIPEVLSQLTGQTLDRLMREGDGCIALLRSRVHESVDKLTIKVDNMKLRHLPTQTDCLLITDVPVGMHVLDIDFFSFTQQSEVNSYGLSVRENEVHSLKIDILRGSDEMRLRAIYPGLTVEDWGLQMGTDFREFNIYTMSLEDLLK